jgi:hypothetical protein
VVTGWWGWDLLIGIAVALLVTWLVLLAALALVRPRGGLLREALRLLPDVLRLIRRPAANPDLPRGGAGTAGAATGLPGLPGRPDPRLHPGARQRR